jgi:DNA-binding beta-propeller fold protein YncE
MMVTRATNRSFRGLWLAVVLVGLLALVATAALAQDAPAAPAAPASATLTLGVATTPAGGQDFWLTAVSFQTSWGSGGKQLGQFRQPRDIDVDAAGNFYISDHRNSRIQKFSAAGGFMGQIGSQGKGQGKLLRPNALSIFGNQLAVADTDNHRVVIYNTNGAFVRQWGTFGTGNGQFNLPNGVAYDAAGDLYVADTWNHRIGCSTARVSASLVARLPADGQRAPPTSTLTPRATYVADSTTTGSRSSTPMVSTTQVWCDGRGQAACYPVGVDVADGFVYDHTFNNRVKFHRRAAS